MNKAELVEAIAKRTTSTKASVETTLDALMETVTGARKAYLRPEMTMC